MPLVKVIGPTPGTKAATAITEIELRKYSHEDPQPGPSPSRPQQPQEEQEQEAGRSSEIQIKFWRRHPQHSEDDDDVPDEVRAVRSVHASFILTLHAHALGYLLFALTQWILLSYIEAVVMFVNEYYYLALIPFILAYVMLLCLLFFYKSLIEVKKAIFYLYNAIVLQLSTIAIALPIVASTFSQLLFSSSISIIAITASIFFASNRRDFYFHEPQYIIAWTFRWFVVSSLGIITAISVQSSYFVSIMTIIMTLLMILFILICGKTLSRSEFIWLDKYGPHLYGSLFYLNYITTFSMCVLLFEQLEKAEIF